MAPANWPTTAVRRSALSNPAAEPACRSAVPSLRRSAFAPAVPAALAANKPPIHSANPAARALRAIRSWPMCRARVSSRCSPSAGFACSSAADRRAGDRDPDGCRCLARWLAAPAPGGASDGPAADRAWRAGGRARQASTTVALEPGRFRLRRARSGPASRSVLVAAARLTNRPVD